MTPEVWEAIQRLRKVAAGLSTQDAAVLYHGIVKDRGQPEWWIQGIRDDRYEVSKYLLSIVPDALEPAPINWEGDDVPDDETWVFSVSEIDEVRLRTADIARYEGLPSYRTQADARRAIRWRAFGGSPASGNR